MLLHMDQFRGYPEQIIALKGCSDCAMSSAGQVFLLTSIFWITKVFGQTTRASTSPRDLSLGAVLKAGQKPPMGLPQRSW